VRLKPHPRYHPRQSGRRSLRSAAPLTAIGDRTFGSLRRHRNFRLFFAGSSVSFVGTWIQQIASYWLILQLTDSAVAVGALALVQTLPITALSLVGGAIADRVNLKRMVIACESVLCVQAALLCVLAATGQVEVWQLYALGLVRGSPSRSTHPHATRSSSRPSAATTSRTPSH